MKLTPFSLELWLQKGKPDCVYTRDGAKVYELHHHEHAHHGRPFDVLSGLFGEHRVLCIWQENGRWGHDGEGAEGYLGWTGLDLRFWFREEK